MENNIFPNTLSRPKSYVLTSYVLRLNILRINDLRP